MKKRNLIATNCPPGVDCDVQQDSNDDSEKTGKVLFLNIGRIDSPIVKFDMHFSECMPKANSLYKILMNNDRKL